MKVARGFESHPLRHRILAEVITSPLRLPSISARAVVASVRLQFLAFGNAASSELIAEFVTEFNVWREQNASFTDLT